MKYTGPVLLPLTPYVRANPSGFQEFTRVYRGDALDALDFEDVSLTDRVIMLHGGYLPATYYEDGYDKMLPVAAAEIDGPFFK